MAQSRLDLEQVRSILAEYRIHNADITLRCDATADDLIDVVEGNRVYIPAIYLLNKIDQMSIVVGIKLSHYYYHCRFMTTGIGYHLQDTRISSSQVEF